MSERRILYFVDNIIIQLYRLLNVQQLFGIADPIRTTNELRWIHKKKLGLKNWHIVLAALPKLFFALLNPTFQKYYKNIECFRSLL